MLEWAGVAKIGLGLGIAALIALGLWKIKRAGRIEAELDQAERTIEEAADAAENRRLVDAGRGVERSELRRKWSKKPRVPGA